MNNRYRNLEDSISALLDEAEAGNYMTAVTMGQQVMTEALSAWSHSHGNMDDELTAAQLLTAAVSAYTSALVAGGMALQGFGMLLTAAANITYHEQPIDKTLDYQDIMMQLYLAMWLRLGDILSELPPSQDKGVIKHVHVITMYLGAMLMYYTHNVGRSVPDHELLPLAYESIDQITGYVGHLPIKDIPVGNTVVNPSSPELLMQDLIARADAIGLLELSE
ncbi:MAG: hypothetical protein NC117_03780 [Pseudoflavonifractor sp.]|nr:hypothetical protein [Pseudoflavonifractor sp.]